MKRNAFTIGEVLVSLTMIGVLSALLYPMLVNNVGNEKLLAIAQEGAADIVQGYSLYQKTIAPSATTQSQDIVDKVSNRVRTITNGTVNALGQCVSSTSAPVNSCIQIESVSDAAIPNAGRCSNGSGSLPCPAGTTYISPCTTLTPCMLLNNGAFVQFDADATIVGDGTTTPEANRHALRFILDPDGVGPQTSATFVLYINSRITTLQYAMGAGYVVPTGVPSTPALFDSTSTPQSTGIDNLPTGPVDPEYVASWLAG
jgi:type II secretory pathway pseudopilin PulG